MASAFRPDLFAGQRALVTGGSSGIGLAIAQAFHAHGAEVHILGRDGKRLEAARQAIGGGAAHQADMRDSARVDEIALWLQARGGVDVLVNAAAGNFPVPFSAMSETAWRSVIDIVLNGTANVCRSVGARMERGSVLNVVAGYAWTGASGVSHSGAAKAGVLNLTKSLAVEWAPRIRVNAVSPGPIDGTEGIRRLADDLGLRGPSRQASLCAAWGRPARSRRRASSWRVRRRPTSRGRASWWMGSKTRAGRSAGCWRDSSEERGGFLGFRQRR